MPEIGSGPGQRVAIGVTGASGALYATRTVAALLERGVHIELVVSDYGRRLLRDELLTTVAQVGGRLGELRFDTDLDVSHAVVRYLELIKLAALLERTGPEGMSVGEALPEVNARLLQAATAEQREIFETSALDESAWSRNPSTESARKISGTNEASAK